ncbi:MAG: 3'-5' exoribonuclease domain-containing protein [Paraclostridium sp.]
MKIFLDTEFTGLHRNTTLISVGIVTDKGDTFYAELTDYDKKQINPWLEEHVINNLMMKNEREGDLTCNGNHMRIKGTKEMVREWLNHWLKRYDEIEVWSDCLAYDWVLFNDIFGTAFDIPENVYYIPFDICTLFKAKGVDPDISREEFAEAKDMDKKHNALYDAEIIKECYKKLMKIGE